MKRVLAIGETPRDLSVFERADADGALDGGGGGGVGFEEEFGEGGDYGGVDAGAGRIERADGGGGGDEAEAAEGGLAARLAAEDAAGVDVEDGDEEDDEGEGDDGGEHDFAVEVARVGAVEEIIVVVVDRHS